MSDEIERLVHEALSESYRAGMEGVGVVSQGAPLLTAIAALRAQRDDARRTAQHWKDEHLAGNAVIERLTAERDALQVHLRAAEEAAGHSEFLSSPLYSTIARIVAERDAAQAEVARLREALETIKTRGYGGMASIFELVRIARAALESKT